MQSTQELSGSSRSQAQRVGGFFSKLELATLEDFARIEQAMFFSPNYFLFSERDAVKFLFVVLEGEVRTSISSSEGKRLSLRIARAGDLLGLSSALSGNPHDTSAETLRPTRIAAIPRREFLAFLANHPDAYSAVVEELSRDVSMACEQLRTVALSSSAPEKLARLLLEWGDRGQATDCGYRFRFTLTHEEIGEFIGTSRETVTRTLTSFKNRRLVAFKGSMMTIPNRAALESFAHA